MINSISYLLITQSNSRLHLFQLVFIEVNTTLNVANKYYHLNSLCSALGYFILSRQAASLYRQYIFCLPVFELVSKFWIQFFYQFFVNFYVKEMFFTSLKSLIFNVIFSLIMGNFETDLISAVINAGRDHWPPPPPGVFLGMYCVRPCQGCSLPINLKFILNNCKV